MTDKQIKDMIYNQLSKPIVRDQNEIEKRNSILHDLVHGDLPAYRKYSVTAFGNSEKTKIMKHVYRIHIHKGRLEVDRIKINDHNIEFETDFHGFILDSSHEEATHEDWKVALDKLIDYITPSRNKHIPFG